ncbi:MAG: histidine phosphatase family protein [Thiovulaceae bacterium]|nr:histidine phosphatase family protein [Sulfurimonadaceae bacterium]
MKKLYIIRHAKSSWKDETLDDFERPLNKRGENDASFMAKILKQKGVMPDIIISSAALRAKTTAELIAKELNFKKQITYNPKLYEANTDNIFDTILTIDDSCNIVFLIGHNPSLNMFVETLVNFQENIPTCGIIELEIDCEYFKTFNSTCTKLLSFDFPKKKR